MALPMPELLVEVGWGPLAPFALDASVTDILVNGHADIWVERAGCLERTAARFASDADLVRLIRHLAWQGGGRIDEVQPLLAIALPAGWRVQAVLPPLSPYPSLALRRMHSQGVNLQDWVQGEALTAEMARFLQAAVAGGVTLLVTGPAGVGKTTLLSALLDAVPAGERIVALEDPPELHLPPSGHCRLSPRMAGPEGTGAISLTDLVRVALRLRPDRLVVGEVRGAEALALLSALGTGHAGSMSTVHAGSPEEALRRLVLLCQLAQPAGLATYTAMWTQAVQMIVHLAREGQQRWVQQIALLAPGGGLRLVPIYRQVLPGQVCRCERDEVPAWFSAQLAGRGVLALPWLQRGVAESGRLEEDSDGMSEQEVGWG